MAKVGYFDIITLLVSDRHSELKPVRKIHQITNKGILKYNYEINEEKSKIIE